MKKPREYYINANNLNCVDTRPFNCDDLVHVREVSKNSDKALEEAVKIIKKGASFGIEECDKWLAKWGNE